MAPHSEWPKGKICEDRSHEVEVIIVSVVIR